MPGAGELAHSVHSWLIAADERLVRRDEEAVGDVGAARGEQCQAVGSDAISYIRSWLASHGDPDCRSMSVPLVAKISLCDRLFALGSRFSLCLLPLPGCLFVQH